MMKKTIVLSLLFSLFIGTTLTNAQTVAVRSSDSQSKKAKNVDLPTGTETPAEITKSMVKAYGLNDEQAAALKLLNEKRAKDLAEVDAAFDAATANAAQKAEIKTIKAEIQSSYDAMLKDLLSEKQYEKYLADEAAKKEKIKGNVNWMANMATRMLGENNINLLGWNGEISDSLKIAQEATNKMVKKYKLDKAQEEKMLALNIAEVSAEIAERRNISLDNASQTEFASKAQEFAKSAKTRSANYERYLKEILDEKQYKKYENAKKAQQARMNQRFGGGFGGHHMW